MRTSYWEDIKQSLYNLYDHKLLEQGAYVNITGGQKDFKGRNISKFYPVIDNELYSVSGHIWQSAFHNFVYESGVVNKPTPIVASGVYVNGVFTPKSNSLHIDYINGRVIFDTAISTSSTVQGDFSYKEYSFVRPDNDRAFKNQTKYSINSNVDVDPFPAIPYSIYLPAIIIEIEGADEKGFQFGGTTETLPTLKLTVIGDHQGQVENIASVLSSTSTKDLPVVAANLGPKFNFFYDLTDNYSFYQWCKLSENFALIKSVKYTRIFNSTTEKEEPSLFGGSIIIEISAIR